MTASPINNISSYFGQNKLIFGNTRSVCKNGIKQEHAGNAQQSRIASVCGYHEAGRIVKPFICTPAVSGLGLGVGARYTMQIAAAGSSGQGLNIHFMSLKSTIALLNHGSGPANLIYCRVKSSIYFKICLFPSFYLRLTPECSPGIVMTVSVCYLLHNYHLAT